MLKNFLSISPFRLLLACYLCIGALIFFTPHQLSIPHTNQQIFTIYLALLLLSLLIVKLLPVGKYSFVTLITSTILLNTTNLLQLALNLSIIFALVLIFNLKATKNKIKLSDLLLILSVSTLVTIANFNLGYFINSSPRALIDSFDHLPLLYLLTCLVLPLAEGSPTIKINLTTKILFLTLAIASYLYAPGYLLSAFSLMVFCCLISFGPYRLTRYAFVILLSLGVIIISFLQKTV